uniref:Homeobox-leucine zipper protein GLABRA 2 n=1 Tax=Rhizophora mucronata TaxID=61149 RepID=A0A2P2NIU8_RHIMU
MSPEFSLLISTVSSLPPPPSSASPLAASPTATFAVLNIPARLRERAGEAKKSLVREVDVGLLDMSTPMDSTVNLWRLLISLWLIGDHEMGCFKVQCQQW